MTHPKSNPSLWQSLLVPALGLLLTASTCLAEEPPQPSASIWIEAETMDTTGFPPVQDNPFRPQHLWEYEMLSDGDWLGMRWVNPAEQPELSHRFHITEPGAYRLYARKFYTFGNFRWRIDEGEWISVNPTEHRSLDWVVFRTEPERVALNWYNMGTSQRLRRGEHLLTIQPIFDPEAEASTTYEGMPMAYDAFLLTQSRFFPSGALKPGEKYNIQTPRAFSFEPDAEAFRASPIDLRWLNENYAGQLGGITALNGELVFRNTLDPARLVGISAVSNLLADTESVEYLAPFLAKRGFNLVRIEIADLVTFARDTDGRLLVALKPERLNNLLDAIALFKEQGIYTSLTWQLRQSPGIDTAIFGQQLGQQIDLSAHAMLSEELVDAQKQVWQALLSSELPNGEPLGQDPALVLITLQQQSSLFQHRLFQTQPRLPEQDEILQDALAAWLSQKYGSLEQALSAWGTDIPAEPSAARRPPLLSLAEIARQGPDSQQARDTAQFLAQSQQAYFTQLNEFLKIVLGYQGLVSFTNKSPEQGEGLGYLNAWANRHSDVTERIAVYRTYLEGKFYPWQIHAGDRYRNRSAISLDDYFGSPQADYALPLRAIHYDNKPYLLTEVSWPNPNQFRSEMPLVTFTLASLQGIDAIGIGYIGGSHWENFPANMRSPVFTPAIMAQMPAFACAYRQGYLPVGNEVAQLNINPQDVFSMAPFPVHEPADSQINAPRPATQPEAPAPSSSFHPASHLTGRVQVNWTQNPTSQYFPPVVSRDEQAIITDDGQVNWQHQQGHFVINAPHIQAVGGLLSSHAPYQLRHLTINSTMDWGIVAVVSLDGKPIDFSDRMLVQVFSNEAPLDRYAEGQDGLFTLRSLGRPPMMISNLQGHLQFNRPDASKLVATALDENGYPTVTAGVGGKLDFLPITLYYLVQKM